MILVSDFTIYLFYHYYWYLYSILQGFFQKSSDLNRNRIYLIQILISIINNLSNKYCFILEHPFIYHIYCWLRLQSVKSEHLFFLFLYKIHIYKYTLLLSAVFNFFKPSDKLHGVILTELSQHKSLSFFQRSGILFSLYIFRDTGIFYICIFNVFTFDIHFHIFTILALFKLTICIIYYSVLLVILSHFLYKLYQNLFLLNINYRDSPTGGSL